MNTYQRKSNSHIFGVMSLLAALFMLAVVSCALLTPKRSFGNEQDAVTPPPIHLFRDVVGINDGDREWNLVWTRGDYMRPEGFGFFTSGQSIWQPVVLIDQLGREWPTTQYTFRESDWYEQCFWRSFKVPPSTPLGVYTISINNKSAGRLSVAKHPKTSRTLSGRNNGPYVMTANTRHIGYGAIIFGDVAVAPGASLEGVTVVNGIVQGSFTNGILKDCRFIRCQVGGMVDWSKPQEYQDHGSLYSNCQFEQTGVSGCCSGCFLTCTFTGRVSGPGDRNGHNFTNERAKRLCMINCTFDKTDRGPILRTAWGDNSDGLYVGVQIHNVNSGTNSNEALCVENNANRFDRNMFFGLRVFNTINHVQIWNTPATGNLFANGIHGPGATISFSGIEPQTWNEARFNLLSAPVLVNRDGVKATNSKVGENTIGLAF